MLLGRSHNDLVWTAAGLPASKVCSLYEPRAEKMKQDFERLATESDEVSLSLVVKAYPILRTLHCENPSPNRIISEIMAESGTIIAMGLNMLFKLSGSSVRPAYPGFMVIKIPHVGFSLISLPSKMKRLVSLANACKMDRICCATTDSTSMLIRLNSSKQPHAPD